jgi:hypothetical protein
MGKNSERRKLIWTAQSERQSNIKGGKERKTSRSIGRKHLGQGVFASGVPEMQNLN